MITIEAPIKVISEANNREHWSKRRGKNGRATNQKIELQYYWRETLKGRRVSLPCLVRLTRIGPKELDTDNLAGAFKAIRDQIAKEIGIDDGAVNQIRFEYAQDAIGKRTYGIRVEVIEQAEMEVAA